MKTIEIDNEVFNLITFLDVDGETTTDHTEAHFVLVQRPEDARPEGVDQTYITYRVRGVNRAFDA